MPMDFPPDLRPEDETTLRRLRVFLAVVDAGGVGDAARVLGVSQPAVSTQIKRLEAELGMSLFRRSGRRLAVSEQGRDIARVLRRGFGELVLTLNAVRDIAPYIELVKFQRIVFNKLQCCTSRRPCLSLPCGVLSLSCIFSV